MPSRSPRSPSVAPAWVGGLLLVAVGSGVVGCGGESAVEIRDVREAGAAGPPAPRSTLDQRMRGMTPGASPHGHAGGPSAPAWSWATPEGWEALPPAPMRIAGWRMAGAPGVECTLSTAGGSLADNVNRWRRQMSLAAVGEDAIAALPERGTLAGQPARWVELEGTYVGMNVGGSGSEPTTGAKMVGLVASMPTTGLFLKMTGPTAAVDGEVPRFLALAATVKERAPDVATPRADAAGSAAERPPLRWTAPAGWKEQPRRTMRLVTFVPEGAPKTEVFVTILSGSAGGTRANLDNWRAQMGAAPMTEAEFAALPRLASLGRQGVMLAVEGAYAGKGDAEGAAGAMLLGFALERTKDMVFVKMTGPADEVRGEVERFRAFCESLRE